MKCRGVRGATTAEANTREEILTCTRQLLALMIRINGIEPEDVGSAVFSLTRDLDAEFPALAARQLGWLDVPLLCTYEVDVPGSLRRCVRVLIHWNTDKPQTRDPPRLYQGRGNSCGPICRSCRRSISPSWSDGSPSRWRSLGRRGQGTEDRGQPGGRGFCPPTHFSRTGF